jgi:hypothetical protein
MIKKIYIFVVIISLAAAGILQASGASCFPGCDRCAEIAEMSCCGMEHEQGHGSGHPVEGPPSCCHFELFPENRSVAVLTEPPASVDHSLILSELQTDTVIAVSEISGIRRLPTPPHQYSVPIYLVKCTFLN